jgi:hypothetical protein
MCGVCGAPPANMDWYSAGIENSVSGRLRARVQLAAAANRILRHVGLKASFYPGASTLSLHSPTGHTVTIQQFSEIWPGVDKLTGQGFDPLDRNAIARQGVRDEHND